MSGIDMSQFPNHNWLKRQEDLFWEEQRRSVERFYATHDFIFKPRIMGGHHIDPQEQYNAYLKTQQTMDTEKQQSTLTRGQQVMDVKFNVGQRVDVASIKQLFANAFDEIDKWVAEKVGPPTPISAENPHNPERQQQHNDVYRLAAMAKTDIENACMHAVKAVTR